MSRQHLGIRHVARRIPSPQQVHRDPVLCRLSTQAALVRNHSALMDRLGRSLDKLHTGNEPWRHIVIAQLILEVESTDGTLWLFLEPLGEAYITEKVAAGEQCGLLVHVNDGLHRFVAQQLGGRADSTYMILAVEVLVERVCYA